MIPFFTRPDPPKNAHPSIDIFLCLDSKSPLREVADPLLRLLSNELCLVLGKLAAQCTSLLCAEIEWEVLLALVEQAQLLSLCGVDDGEDACDGFADVVAVKGETLASS